MSDTKRKYNAQTNYIQQAHIELTKSNDKSRKKRTGISKNNRKKALQPELIYDIIERIKDL